MLVCNKVKNQRTLIGDISHNTENQIIIFQKKSHPRKNLIFYNINYQVEFSFSFSLTYRLDRRNNRRFSKKNVSIF